MAWGWDVYVFAASWWCVGVLNGMWLMLRISRPR